MHPEDMPVIAILVVYTANIPSFCDL